ncbi:MAG TPA: HPF/RaiA family ribosome-associated protein [Vicinamibacteria bacterium]|nr:HPF/RaiA family ribosome-associated protein [Vicinamibacteria bacterium]
MRISVRALGMEATDAIREHVERRLLFAVGRFSGRLEEVNVRLGDANGPRGGTDKTCRVVAGVGGAGQVVVEDADADLYVAVDRATSRLGRAVARAVDRRREAQGRRSLGWPAFRPTLAAGHPVFGME